MRTVRPKRCARRRYSCRRRSRCRSCHVQFEQRPGDRGSCLWHERNPKWNQRGPDRGGHEHGPSRDECARRGSLCKTRCRFSRCAYLWMMAAGNKAIFEKVKPVLEHLGQTVHYFGKNGNATAMKLVGNLIVALELEALAEGLVLAQKAGLDLNTVMEVVKVADFRSPLLVGNGQNILKRDFSTSFALKLMLNDTNLIGKFGESLKSPIPGLRIVEKNLESAVTLGFGKENASAVIKALEKEAGVEVKARRVNE